MLEGFNSHPKIGVIGSHWGLALATNFVRKGFPVNLWEKNIKIAQDIKREHANTHFADIRSIYLNPLITISSEIEILKDTNLLVIAIPCRALKEVYQTIYHFQDLFRAELIIVGTTKGIEKETHHLPYQICDEALGQPGLLIPYHYVHLAGPGFAADVMQNQPVRLVAASNEKTSLEEIQKIFNSPTLKVYRSSDLLGIQLAAAQRVVLSVGLGAAKALGLSDSTRAAMMTRMMAECVRFGVTLGAQEKTYRGLAGWGDAVLCLSEESRNFKLGFELGEGKSLQRAIDLLSHHGHPEGIDTAQALYSLYQEKAAHLDLPYLKAIYQVTDPESGVNIKQIIDEISLREPGEE